MDTRVYFLHMAHILGRFVAYIMTIHSSEILYSPKSFSLCNPGTCFTCTYLWVGNGMGKPVDITAARSTQSIEYLYPQPDRVNDENEPKNIKHSQELRDLWYNSLSAHRNNIFKFVWKLRGMAILTYTRPVCYLYLQHIPGTCITCVHVGGTFYFRHLATKLCAHILQMLRKFQIVFGIFIWTPGLFLLDVPHTPQTFPGHFPGHPGCFFGFSTHPWDMYCIPTCGWPMLFSILSIPPLIPARFCRFRLESTGI